LSGFTAIPDESWPFVYAAIRAQNSDREWPEELALVHLRWMHGQRRQGLMKPSAFPTVRELAAEWNWRTPSGEPARDRASLFLSRTRIVQIDGKAVEILHWQDEHRHATLEWLRGHRQVKPKDRRRPTTPDSDPTDSRQRPDSDPTDGTDERRESEAKPDSDPTGTRQTPDSDPTTRAISARASTAHSSQEERDTPRANSPTRKPPEDFAPLGLRPMDLGVIAEYCDTPEDLLCRTQAEISRWRGLGDPGGERVAKACSRAGWPLGSVPRPAATNAPSRGETAPVPAEDPWSELTQWAHGVGEVDPMPEPTTQRQKRLLATLKKVPQGTLRFKTRDRYTEPELKRQFLAVWNTDRSPPP
jgi:hypothetical protein